MRDYYYDCYEDWGNNLDDWDGVSWSNHMSGPDDWEIENRHEINAENWAIECEDEHEYEVNESTVLNSDYKQKKERTKPIQDLLGRNKKSSKNNDELIFLSFTNASDHAKNCAINAERTFLLKRVDLVGTNQQFQNCWKVSL
ncbi:hypothetical protein OAJ35_01855 [Gammaproteobacteria bacterium]|nr:hypothetical protein [Gammaproteobacteria bacterium]